MNASDQENHESDQCNNDSAQQSIKPPTNLKVYEWAEQWGCKPRQVIQAARSLNLRVQNRLTRLTKTDAARVLSEIQNPAPEPKAP